MCELTEAEMRHLDGKGVTDLWRNLKGRLSRIGHIIVWDMNPEETALLMYYNHHIPPLLSMTALRDEIHVGYPVQRSEIGLADLCVDNTEPEESLLKGRYEGQLDLPDGAERPSYSRYIIGKIFLMSRVQTPRDFDRAIIVASSVLDVAKTIIHPRHWANIPR